MESRKEINDFYALVDMVWSGAVDTIADIQHANKEDEPMNFLEAVFCMVTFSNLFIGGF